MDTRKTHHRGGRQMGRRTLLGSALAGSAATAFILACGGGSKSDSGSAGSVEVTVAPSNRQAETAQPKPGGTLNVRQAGNAPLDPHLNSTYIAQTLASYVYSRLLKYKTGPDPMFANNYDVEPDLAESYEVNGDGTQITFKLRANAKWQDVAPVSGRAVDAEDVKFSLERFRTDPKSTNRAVFGTQANPMVESIEAPDARTVVFKLAKPYGPFLKLIANSNYLWIMPKEIGAGGFDPAKQMIGTGPFMLESTQPDIAYKTKKNPTYFGGPMPYVDGVNHVIITETAQEVAQFQAGRLDVAAIQPNRVAEVRQSVPKAELLEFIPSTYGFLAPQLRGSSPFKDERLRRALSMAVDRDGILQLAYEGKGAWQTFFMGQFSKYRLDPKGADLGEGAQWFKYNPAEAKKLLSAAGHPNGLETRYIFTNNIYGERFNQVAEAIASMLKDAGFKPQIVPQDYLREYIAPGTGTYFGNFEGVFYGLSTEFGDPHDYLYNMNHSKSTRNHAGVNDPELDAMIDKEGAMMNEEERVKAVKDIQRYMATKMYYSPGAIGPDFLGVREWVKNYQRNNSFGAGSESRMKLWLDRGG